MSSSDAPVPSPWALDELEFDDLFTPLAGFGPVDDSAAVAEQEYNEQAEADRVAEAEFDARVSARLAALRPAIEAEAFARGQAAGDQQAREAARAQIAAAAHALDAAMASVRTHEQLWLGNIEENLAAVAVTVARHLIHKELAVDPTVITQLVSRAIKAFPMERALTVRLHPDDHAIVQDALQSAELTSPAAYEIHWLSDAHIVRGGCLVEGRERVLDGRIDTALERTYRALSQVQA